MATLLESANQALETKEYRHEILNAAFGRISPELDSKLISCIPDEDQMLRHCLDHYGQVNPAVSQYLAVAIQQYETVRQLQKILFSEDEQSMAFLDFACGYGRLQRLFSLQVDIKTVWASDIQEDAMTYVTKSFGVNGIDSYADPDLFRTDKKFDFIWVASLFSHLPSHLFQAWLERLSSLLTPTGVLCFSVHDQCLVPDSVTFPDTGLYYVEYSENPDLDVSIYGTTFVSEAFVAAAGAKVSGPQLIYRRIPKCLANHQDVYVFTRGVRDLSRLGAFRNGAWGSVDNATINLNGELYISGWAASLDDGDIDSVEVKLNGQVHICKANIMRKDVVDVLNDPRMLMSGWETHLPLLPLPADNFVVVTVVSMRGERAMIYLGFIQSP